MFETIIFKYNSSISRLFLKVLTRNLQPLELSTRSGFSSNNLYHIFTVSYGRLLLCFISAFFKLCSVEPWDSVQTT